MMKSPSIKSYKRFAGKVFKNIHFPKKGGKQSVVGGRSWESGVAGECKVPQGIKKKNPQGGTSSGVNRSAKTFFAALKFGGGGGN